MDKIFEIILPVKIYSENNMSQNPWVKRKRTLAQKFCVGIALKNRLENVIFPCLVKLIRLSTKPLDPDNLQFSFKAVRDEVANRLIPGLRPGMADGDPRIKWEYEEQKEKGNSLKIEIFCNN